ncbi:MAG TPA: ATP-binding protein [Thermomicrobiaceae bacterium]|nr:ATP-binding protein [Thermomicrobiaceae bacterium]
MARAVQRQVDLVCLAAMELQHEEPDVSVVGQVHALLREITARAESGGVAPIVEGARLVTQAIAVADFESQAPTPYMGHFVTATAADLARVVHALLGELDPAPILSHARETLRLMPRRSTDFLVEVDLDDPEQVARIFAAVTEEEPELTVVQPVAQRAAPPSRGQPARLRELRQLLATYVTHVEKLRAQPERRETLDDLLVGAKALRASAAAANLSEVNRVLGRLIAVIDAQRASPEGTTSDMVAFALACARAIGEAIASPDGSSEMFATLHEASSRLLHHFQVDTRQFQTGLLSSEPAGERRTLYQALSASQPGLAAPEPVPADRDEQERLRQDLAVALAHLPETIARLERDRHSVAARAALAQLIQLVRDAAGGAGLDALSARCAELEQALVDAGFSTVPVDALAGARQLAHDLERLVRRADARADDAAPRATIPVDVAGLGEVVGLAQELTLKRGQHAHEARSRLLGAGVQEIAVFADRLRALAEREEASGSGLADELVELAADAAILAADVGRWRAQDDRLDARTARVLGRLRREAQALGHAPLDELLPPLERTARGLADRLGKQISFQAELEGATLPRAAAGRLADALLHLVRNAVDYGIEPPDLRRARGKPETGTLVLRARQDAGELLLEVTDDGAGIDDAQIVQRAIESGYPIPAEGLSRERVLQLLLLPGLTTRPAGARPSAGQGLAVVGTIAAELKGSVQIASTLGVGTTIRLRLPGTLSSLTAVVVALGDARYALPFLQAEPVARPLVRQSDETGDETGFVAELAGRRFPAADLGALLGLRSAWSVDHEGGTWLRVRQESEEQLIRVDALIGRRELALQPLDAGAHPHPPGAVARAELEPGDMALVIDLAQAFASRGAAAGMPAGESPAALVADDSIAARRAIGRVLERHGWRTLEARDGLEAWELLGSVAPALLVIDLDLALLDAAQVIRAAQDQHGIPVIALAGRAGAANQHQLHALRVDAVLGKPIDEDDLAAALGYLAPLALRR